ncbi:MAG: hypothetical protein QOJ35_899 [Solirubrobacteraceae bacterium]|jgi:hypothetical protein|nr:hypothetical protein [Solirubrobacteraceae bacterium]
MATRPSMTMTTSHPHTGVLAVAATLALVAVAAAPASAAAPSAPKQASFALTAVSASGALRLRGTPGRVLRGAVRVRNVSQRRITVRLQPADIRNAVNGNADYVTSGLAGTGRWLHLAAAKIRLSPLASRTVTFTVRVPARARGASHYAGVVAVDVADLAAAVRARSRTTRSITISRINRQALPLTIRLPGPLTHRLALRAVKIDVQAAGAYLMLGLRPGGTVLIQSAPVRLRVSRGSRTILRHSSTLGQLFPHDDLDFRIPWNGRPTEGDYRVRGVIRPKAAKPIYFDRTLTFTPAKVSELNRETTPVAGRPAAPGLPMWVWLVLTGGAALLIALSLAFWRVTRRDRRSQLPAEPPPLVSAAPDPSLDERADRHHRTAA